MASFQQDIDWQSTKKTVLERSRHMFNNPFMSDVVFTCEGSDKKIFAHKYVLATSSAVFYTMFYGKLAETNSVVHLSDTNEASLAEFLRFLYTDEYKLTTDNATFVLYLAKKYIVPSLAEECIKFLDANLAAENAFIVLQQAIQSDENKLEEKSWELIDFKTSEAVASDAFSDINQATLVDLLKRDSLNVKEVDLFKAVLKWSEAECPRKGMEANSNNRRGAMRNAIYQIRFASMTLHEFDQITSESGVLTPEEMVLFHEKFSGVERASEVWNMSEREKQGILLRCCRFAKYGFWPFYYASNMKGAEYVIGISFSKAVKIHGVRLLGNEGKEYDVQIEVCSRIMKNKFTSQRDSCGISGFDVMLLVSIKVQANVAVYLKATIRQPTICAGFHGKTTVKANGTTINFFNSPDGRTSVEQGQFYQIIFSEI